MSDATPREAPAPRKPEGKGFFALDVRQFERICQCGSGVEEAATCLSLLESTDQSNVVSSGGVRSVMASWTNGACRRASCEATGVRGITPHGSTGTGCTAREEPGSTQTTMASLAASQQFMTADGGAKADSVSGMTLPP